MLLLNWLSNFLRTLRRGVKDDVIQFLSIWVATLIMTIKNFDWYFKYMKIFILLTMFSYCCFVWSKDLPKDFMICGSAEDCTYVNEDCCQQGKWVLVNKELKGKAVSIFCPERRGQCPAVTGPRPPSDSEIKCINKVCSLVQMSEATQRPSHRHRFWSVYRVIVCSCKLDLTNLCISIPKRHWDQY